MLADVMWADVVWGRLLVDDDDDDVVEGRLLSAVIVSRASWHAKLASMPTFSLTTVKPLE